MSATAFGSSIRVMVIGAGWHMTSGISHYTYRLSVALADRCEVSALLMRGLVPKRLYPGASRVGADVNDAVYPASIPVYDGLDWYWGQSMRGALKFIDEQRPEVVILQWWTGAVLHSYLRLARYAQRRGARILMEWHESQDVGEASLPGARQYVGSLMPRLLSCVSGHVVHSEFDLSAITSVHSLSDSPMRVIPHGAYDHLTQASRLRPISADSPVRLLYLGVVRSFKGVEDLVAAFNLLDRAEAERYRLTIVGETWEGWTAPNEAIERSPYKDLIDRVDRYVTDAELAGYYGDADAVVLPYHRSSASGPLSIAMSAGLPVVVTAVGGLIEAVRDYPGALLVPPCDPVALREALVKLPELCGIWYADPHPWENNVEAYYSLINEVRGRLPAVDRAGSLY